MILKSFELNKLKLENYNFYLFYGDNEGLKEDTIKNFFEKPLILRTTDASFSSIICLTIDSFFFFTKP